MVDDIQQERRMLKDRGGPVVRFALRNPRRVHVVTAAIAEAWGQSVNELLIQYEETMNASVLDEATPEQRARYEKALARIEAETPNGDDEPEPTVKARTGAKKGGK